MYLKNIKAHGFKSFADKINIELDTKLTGIVGPNGSGKSNIVDAVRWVLGEQSVKSLRGDTSMTDIIFSGSKSRNPLNVASVTLVLDNSDNYLPLAFNEISIQRRVYKDGSNEYYLNNEKCRLKDILDLLVDSGFGKDSLNIISQGEVESIISSKPTDRRVLIEEAAGVLKYKKRKEEALRKLEKTNDNMSRVDDIIGELEIQVNPLKEQKEKAEQYLKIKKELENIEIALIANDIKNISADYKEKLEKIEILKNEILNMSTSNSKSNAKLETLKIELTKISQEIQEKNKELLEKTKTVEKINSRKNIILERKKYEVEDSKLHQNLVDLQEKKMKLENECIQLDNEITLNTFKETEIITKYKEQETVHNHNKDLRNKKEQELTFKYREKNNLKNKIELLKENIENNGLLPQQVRKILNNPKLRGIHNVIGNLIEVEERYSTAISTTLGASANNIVVDNELNAKEAIEYLKNNNLGRATFFPLNIIKPKQIDNYNELTNLNGFIDIASNLVKYDKKYDNIIRNQLGNIIVCEDINSANYISRKTNYRYRIVTLDGQLLHVGGSISGGSSNNTKNIITLKYELEEKIEQEKRLLNDIKLIEDKINEYDNIYQAESDKLYIINKEKIQITDSINLKRKNLLDLNEQINLVDNEIKSINMLNNSLSKEEDEVIKEYYEALKEKDLLVQNINILNENYNDLHEKMSIYEHSIKQENTLYNTKNKELNSLEIETNRQDVKLDNLLNVLSETYNMTYEKAISQYSIDNDDQESRTKVNTYKRQLKELGMVNINAIEEYDRVKERYDFLTSQKEDLINASNVLLEIIKEMDDVMTEDFTKTFEIIKENFKLTFKELFKGGKADLVLTDPENMLETGIEIVACPPGKKLSSISLLSGGEKTFTAISLLFAILKSRPVPFCILDEVEAALDDANVNSFGLYLKELQAKTQFILITHKKRTMEFVDTLYGITMQESGVSKLVSVKLEDIKR